MLFDYFYKCYNKYKYKEFKEFMFIKFAIEEYDFIYSFLIIILTLYAYITYFNIIKYNIINITLSLSRCRHHSIMKI